MSSTAQETFQNGPRSQFLDPSINTLNPQSSVSGLQPLPSFSPKQRRYTVDRQTATTSSPRADLTSIKPLLAIPESPKATTSGDPVPASFLTSFVHSSAPLLPPSNSFPHSLYTLPKSVEVQCKARTRVPTPHGPVFLHIYHNNLDSKEHLAIVIDPEQLDSDLPSQYSIRSKSLDAVWNERETDMDRLVRGAYIGRLSSTRKVPSAPFEPILNSTSSSSIPPIVRIHSECYTGETIGSMRCDCGEQLDEAIRCISKPQLVPSLLLLRNQSYIMPEVRSFTCDKKVEESGCWRRYERTISRIWDMTLCKPTYCLDMVLTNGV
ncbi:uncharacterized protein EI90DRAFT_2445327 [Cantharellus anzutake]|uniref:uncharacterized protein n=1 Tax=Cantharellus anzutake TaxID=1750568 RepID=UPI0019033935|nr:uncharacterized protein EI90DRAFT_2445327 [Cantharellus anzutake]KAF8339016.1 hypothetical protein EI90DRAFT_2445327 [Cantharellus anzutake]